ncbi:phage upper tail fiber protein [Hoeflea sp.]|uniref:phage upper tail fiber protein n=1 Tax=Hoeflea sp. TaxID=1940281 RepID=UPI003B52EE39
MSLESRLSSFASRLATEFNSVREALNGKVSGTGVTAVVKLTQAEYDALSPPDATTLYVIVD